MELSYVNTYELGCVDRTLLSEQPGLFSADR